MAIELPPLPFSTSDLEPYISKRTIEVHYEKHHRGYVDQLNYLIQDTPLESESLEEIIMFSNGRMPEVFNNAAQAWNHAFFWQGLARNSDGPSLMFEIRAARDFGSFEYFKRDFNDRCKTLFGSGWIWLVKDERGTLRIRSLENAGTPLVDGEMPLLACDVWEHAYYLDYQNERMKYVENFWKVVNWPAVDARLDRDTPKIPPSHPEAPRLQW